MMKIVWFLLITSFIFSCNKTTAPEKPNETPVKNLNTDEPAYPHEKNFFKTHGTSFLRGKESCLGCHGKDGSGGTAKVSCLECHSLYPHVNFLGVVDMHAISFQKSPQSCSKCHGEDWRGGNTGVSCFKCHENFPHPAQWAKPDQHGKAFVAAADKKQCLTCHDANKEKGKEISTRCDACHVAYPHDSKFVLGKGNHPKLAASYEGKCLLCHRDYKENMPNNQDPDEGIGCFSCHSGKIEIKWKEEDAIVNPNGSNGLLQKKMKRIPTNLDPHHSKK